MTYQPLVRFEELKILQVDQELIIYDPAGMRAHRANLTAATTLQNCDGFQSVHDLAKLYSIDIDPKDKEAIVWVTLADMAKADLLNSVFLPPADLDVSRKKLVKYAEQEVLEYPIVESVLTPSLPRVGALFSGWNFTVWSPYLIYY